MESGLLGEQTQREADTIDSYGKTAAMDAPGGRVFRLSYQARVAAKCAQPPSGFGLVPAPADP